MQSLEELFIISRVKTQCDLDLLLFFVRHPEVLMTSEQLALFVGYDLAQIAKSLDLLVQRKLLRRTQSPTHAARLYRFSTDVDDPRFHELLKAAASIEGRREIRRLLSERSPGRKRTVPKKTSSFVSGEGNLTLLKEKANG